MINAIIHADQDGYTVECLEAAVVTQGSTFDEAVRNLNEALALHVEGEDLRALGLSEPLRVRLTFEASFSLIR